MRRRLVLVAMPVGSVSSLIAGATVGVCMDCGCQVWISPSSATTGYDHVKCVVCVADDESSADRLQGPNHHQVAELLDRSQHVRLQGDEVLN